MTTAAIKSESHPNGSCCFRHIHDIVDAVFFSNSTAFPIDRMISQETSSEFLFLSRIWEEVTSNLPDCKFIKWHIVIKRFNDPITPWPHCPFTVALVTIAISITSRIKPFPGHPFSICFRVEEFSD